MPSGGSKFKSALSMHVISTLMNIIRSDRFFFVFPLKTNTNLAIWIWTIHSGAWIFLNVTHGSSVCCSLWNCHKFLKIIQHFCVSHLLTGYHKTISAWSTHHFTSSNCWQKYAARSTKWYIYIWSCQLSSLINVFLIINIDNNAALFQFLNNANNQRYTTIPTSNNQQQTLLIGPLINTQAGNYTQQQQPQQQQQQVTILVYIHVYSVYHNVLLNMIL